MFLQMTGNNSLKNFIFTFREELSRHAISAYTGLGPDLFNFISSLTPIVNVDLLVYNSKGQFLLSMRDDQHCGRGWHIPGGCIRFKETIDSRIKEVAKKELSLTDFTYDKDPIKVFEIMWGKDQRNLENDDERAHFITLVYKCYVPDTYIINNPYKSEKEAGYLKWFDTLPNNLLSIQNCYREILK